MEGTQLERRRKSRGEGLGAAPPSPSLRETLDDLSTDCGPESDGPDSERSSEADDWACVPCEHHPEDPVPPGNRELPGLGLPREAEAFGADRRYARGAATEVEGAAGPPPREADTNQEGERPRTLGGHPRREYHPAPGGGANNLTDASIDCGTDIPERNDDVGTRHHEEHDAPGADIRTGDGGKGGNTPAAPRQRPSATRSYLLGEVVTALPTSRGPAHPAAKSMWPRTLGAPAAERRPPRTRGGTQPRLQGRKHPSRTFGSGRGFLPGAGWGSRG